jgi:hypothetical protein
MRVHTKAGRARWWASIVADASVIEQFRPPTGSVGIDNANGRLLLTYAGGKRRSVSWTHRGMEEATKVALQPLWGWHEEATGEPCPLPL